MDSDRDSRASSKANKTPRKKAATKSRSKAADGPDRPARDTRFKPGQSGNPNGRPRKERRLHTIIEAELDAEMQVTESGQAVRLSKREVLAKTLVNNAIKGDHKALAALLKVLPPAREDDHQDHAAVPLQTVLDFLARKGHRPEEREAES